LVSKDPSIADVLRLRYVALTKVARNNSTKTQLNYTARWPARSKT